MKVKEVIRGKSNNEINTDKAGASTIEKA